MLRPLRGTIFIVALALLLAGCAQQTSETVWTADNTPLIDRDVLLGNPEKAAVQISADGTKISYLAPVDGVIDSILFEPGERPQVGQAFMILLAGEQPYARVYIPEPIRIAVRPGDAARIFVDGLDQPLDGRVRWVASESAFTPYFALTQHDRGRLTYFAKIDLPNTDDWPK